MNRLLFALLWLGGVASAYGQQEAKVVLGMVPLLKPAEVKEEYRCLLQSEIERQVDSVRGLSRVAIDLCTFQKRGCFGDEEPSMADVSKESGADHLFVGEISKVSIREIPLQTSGAIVCLPLRPKQVVFVVTLQIINLATTEVEAAKQIHSSIIPLVTHRSKATIDMMMKEKIAGMSGQFREFMQAWYDNLIKTVGQKEAFDANIYGWHSPSFRLFCNLCGRKRQACGNEFLSLYRK